MIKSYDSYKDSRVEWIGDIPSSWELIRGKFVFQKKKEINNENQELNLLSLTLSGVLNKDINSNDGLRPTEYSTYQIFEKDDLVFKLIDLENTQTSRVGLVHERGIMSPVYIRLEPQKRINSKYSYYYYYDLYKQHIYNFLGSGVRSSLTPSNLLEIELPLPPLSEQQQIVSFLDTKTTLIDSLIEKTQRKIELLKEKKTSLISEVVTKGLNPNVNMKDSGVEWIGDIPDNWNWKRMCYMFKPVSIKNTSGEINLSVYRDYGVIPTNSRDDNHNVISEDTSNYKLVNVGDFVMNKMKCWMGSLGLSDYRGIVSPSYTVMKPLTQSNRKYLHYLLRSQIYIPQYRKLSYGVRIGQWDMRFEDFRELPCLIPPLSEQRQIVEYLDEQTQKIDNTISIEEKRIELLKEYRQSLISEVVTGKRKVV
jgi:type I restriction enzyme S subunit